MKEYYSPLRYPGGKTKVIPSIKKIIEENNLSGLDYAEPYAGGASIALSLAIDNYCSKVYINDKDLSIYSFWFSILKAGVIGGKEQKGNYKIDERFNKDNLIERISKIAEKKNKIVVYNMDGIEFIKKISKNLKPNSFIYLDPPYYKKGKELYLNHFQHSDHERVKDYIVKLSNFNWIISYDNTPEIRQIYSSYRKKYYNLNYSLINGSKGEEVLIIKKGLYIPKNTFEKM